jgi:Zn-dependent protease with chaperone function
MPADLPAAGLFVLSWAATYLMHSTCLLAGVWFYMRVRPRTGHTLRETLWKTALVGSIVTASVQMLPGLRGSFAEVTVAVNEPGSARAPAGPLAGGSAGADGMDVASIELSAWRALASETAAGSESGDIGWTLKGSYLEELTAVCGENATAQPGRTEDAASISTVAALQTHFAALIRTIPPGTILAIAVTAAVAAVVLGMARCAWQTWSLRRRLLRCTAIESGPARRLLDELRRMLPNTPEVQLLSATDDPEPAAFGLTRWTIVLPARAVHDLSEDELRALLAHELAHLVRGDSLWLCVSRVVCSCLAFQPLNHLARREWQRAAEFLCDSWAVSRTGTPLALARCLAEVAGWRLSGDPSPALLAATGRKSGLADRIERLVETSDCSQTWTDLRRRRWLLLAGGLLLGIAAWCFPRVEVALAEAATKLSAEAVPGEAAVGAHDISRVGERTANATDAAKAQANGDASVAPAEVNDSPAGLPPAGSAPVAERPPAIDLTALLQSLDRDLSGLERDLGELEPLLAKENTPPQVSALAKRLHAEIAQLTNRRNALRLHLKKTASVRSLRK